MMVQDQEEVDAAVNGETDDSLVRVATTATSLDAEQDRGSGPRRQETMEDTIAQTRSENASKLSNDPLLARGVERYLNDRPEDEGVGVENWMAIQTVGGWMRVEGGMGVEGEGVWSFVVWFKGFKRGVREVVNYGDEVIVESVDVVNTAKETRSVVKEVTDVTIPVSAATTTTTTTTTAITDDEITLAKALAEQKRETPTLAVSSQQPSEVKVQDKGKSKMVEPEPVKKMSKKDLLRLDEELAFKLQAEEEKKRGLPEKKLNKLKKLT
ncbi:hypothetical protein Tco_1290418 [Tanacetum coccineum]